MFQPFTPALPGGRAEGGWDFVTAGDMGSESLIPLKRLLTLLPALPPRALPFIVLMANRPSRRPGGTPCLNKRLFSNRSCHGTCGRRGDPGGNVPTRGVDATPSRRATGLGPLSYACTLFTRDSNITDTRQHNQSKDATIKLAKMKRHSRPALATV